MIFGAAGVLLSSHVTQYQIFYTCGRWRYFTRYHKRARLTHVNTGVLFVTVPYVLSIVVKFLVQNIPINLLRQICNDIAELGVYCRMCAFAPVLL